MKQSSAACLRTEHLGGRENLFFVEIEGRKRTFFRKFGGWCDEFRSLRNAFVIQEMVGKLPLEISEPAARKAGMKGTGNHCVDDEFFALVVSNIGLAARTMLLYSVEAKCITIMEAIAKGHLNGGGARSVTSSKTETEKESSAMENAWKARMRCNAVVCMNS
mmetsp:Transcript_25119/g.46830  ORF Transcript_25119/g.46830 Transcript_25119/m.46830 type:complete len:162 (+) Transcript_25119:63-548(+)